jgi:hypothetical protein
LLYFVGQCLCAFFVRRFNSVILCTGAAIEVIDADGLAVVAR